MRNKKILLLLCLFLGPITSMIYVIMDWDVSKEYPGALPCLCLCNLFLFACFGFIISRKSYSLFEPIVFTIFLYYMIFVYSPMRNINSGLVYQGGVNTMGGCVYATLIFMVSFVFMLLGYYSKQPVISMSNDIDYDVDEYYYDKKKLLLFSWIMWVVGIVFFMIYNINVGRNPLYMLTFGLLNRGLREGESFSITFFSSLVYLSFFPMMNILIHGKSRLLKMLVLYITAVPLATRGFRNVVVIVLGAPIVYYYLKRKKKPSLYACIFFALAFVFVFGFLASTRGSLRIGQGADLSGYEYSDGVNGMLDYFNSYRVFYGAVEQYPSHFNYTYGKQLSYFFVMFIPRFFWPGKPAPAIVEVIGNSTSSISASSGAAWPNIGEYYTDFGVIGTVLCMFILGFLLKRMKGLYYNKKATRATLILYSLYLPALVAIIAYGYTAGNAPKFIFMAIPYWLQKTLCKKKPM